jgi:hypothetical protein
VTATLSSLGLEDAARQAAGNWRKFHSFVWWRATDLDDPDGWAILYTHNRDSGLLDHSNAAAIGRKLEPFTEGDDSDVVAERHDHWACGWIDGFAVRVFKNGKITAAFRAYHELAERLADYPVLDETDYSNREYDATVQYIEQAGWRLKREFALPDGWPSEVFSWLRDHNDRAVENKDDQGGYPSEHDLEEAFVALGYTRAA